MLRVESGVIYVNVPVAGEKTLRVFDVQGHLMQGKTFTGNATSLGLESLPHGNYIVQLDAGGRVLKKGIVRF